jgi:hypothetical protein
MSYRLANCVCLLGAVYGDVDYLPALQELMKAAQAADKHLDDSGTRKVRRAEVGRWQLSVGRSDDDSLDGAEAAGLLAWAKARAGMGKLLPGARWATAEEQLESARAHEMKMGAMQGAEHYEGVLAALPATVPELRARLQVPRMSLVRALTALELAGMIERTEERRHKPGKGLPPRIWRRK